jgi:hypothetical protein
MRGLVGLADGCSCIGRAAGVWNPFPLALVVLLPSGALLRGPVCCEQDDQVGVYIKGHTSWSYEGARIHLATLAIAKQPIFAFSSSLPSAKGHILVVQVDFEGCFWCLVAWCFGSETVYALVFGRRSLLLLVHSIFLVRPGGKHDFSILLLLVLIHRSACKVGRSLE